MKALKIVNKLSENIESLTDKELHEIVCKTVSELAKRHPEFDYRFSINIREIKQKSFLDLIKFYNGNF